MKRSRNILAAILVLFISMGSVQAVMVMDGGLSATWGPTANPTMNDWNSWEDGMNSVEDNGDGTFSLEDGWMEVDNCTVDFTLLYKEDPWVDGGFTVTNTSSETQTFVLTFTSPVSPMLTGSVLVDGSMSGSYSAGPDGIKINTVTGVPLFEGVVEGVSVLSFYPDYSEWVGGAFASGIIDEQNQDPPLVGPSPVTMDLEIIFTFDLSPGDVATMNGRMDVVPEPATMVLLGLGGLLIRRRK